MSSVTDPNAFLSVLLESLGLDITKFSEEEKGRALVIVERVLDVQVPALEKMRTQAAVKQAGSLHSINSILAAVAPVVIMSAKKAGYITQEQVSKIMTDLEANIKAGT